MKSRWTLRFAIGAMVSLALCADSIHAAELPPEKDPLKAELLGPAMQKVEEENGEAQTRPEEKAKQKPKPAEKPSRGEEEDEELKEENGDDKKFKLGKYFQVGGAIEVEAAILNDFEEPCVIVSLSSQDSNWILNPSRPIGLAPFLLSSW
jgi:hypothetical protein